MTTHSNVDMTTIHEGPTIVSGQAKYVSIQVIHVGGKQDVHSVVLEGSLNGDSWIEMETSAGGTPGLISIRVMGGAYFRYIIKTAEPTASVCDIITITE